MAERQGSITPKREENRLTRGRTGQPFGILQRFADEMDRMFDDFGLGRRSTRWLSPWRETGVTGMWSPDVEVLQKDDRVTIKADLPGLKRDEVSIDITDDAVTIQGERRAHHEEEREGYYRSERSYGSFCRVIPLPEGAITEQAKATFQNGVLEITVPAPPAARGRRLEISEGAKT